MCSTSVHIPILVQPIVQCLIEPFLQLPDSAPPHWMVDCTLGGGGHTQAFLQAFQNYPKLQRHRVIALDQDLCAVENAQKRFAKEVKAGWLEIHHLKMGAAQSLLTDADRNGKVLGLMADLGFSSDQLEDPSRGLSFQTEGPLDMRLDPSEGMSCQQFLVQSSERELLQILQNYGEERFSRRIAAAIHRAKMETGIPNSTLGLVEIIRKAVPPPYRYGRIHFATRTFQALRIAVNHELEELDSLLKRVIINLKSGGRVAIISFHSLEDRRVKFAFKEAPFRALTKKPIEADEKEIQTNPRSRSAKLRVGEHL